MGFSSLQDVIALLEVRGLYGMNLLHNGLWSPKFLGCALFCKKIFADPE